MSQSLLVFSPLASHVLFPLLGRPASELTTDFQDSLDAAPRRPLCWSSGKPVPPLPVLTVAWHPDWRGQGLPRSFISCTQTALAEGVWEMLLEWYPRQPWRWPHLVCPASSSILEMLQFSRIMCPEMSRDMRFPSFCTKRLSTLRVSLNL